MTDAQNNSNLDDELLSAYIDGELTDAERTAVETRLETDPPARELVAEMRSLSGTLKSLPREALAEDLRTAVLSQIGDRQASLPRTELSMARRLMWPAIAIAAALMLMFFQGNERSEVDKVASVDGRAAERHERALAEDRNAAFEAPQEGGATLESAAAPASPAPVAGDRAVLADADARPVEAAAGAVLGEAIDESAVAARRATAALADGNAELEGVVHLTLTDFRLGAERFNRLLIANGVQLVDEQAVAGEPASTAAPAAAAPSTGTFHATGQVADTISTRSVAPMGGMGGGAKASSPAEASSAVSDTESREPEMVLVEAPPKQIEQILFGCAQDTEGIEDVTVDPTASGINTAPAKQRLSDYQQYSRSSSKPTLGNEYKVTPEQQSAIAVFNSVPKQAEAAESSDENQQQQGWAARFYAGQQPVEKDQLNWQYNQYRDQYFSNRTRQQSFAKKLAKDKAVTEQPVRVLFLLHPSQEPAKK